MATRLRAIFGATVIPELEGWRPPDRAGSDRHGRFPPKLPNPDTDTYRFTTHRKYLAGFIDAVIGSGANPSCSWWHDWGSALGFDWANHHRDRVRGIAYMEGIVRPVAGWEEWSAAATPIFQGFSLRPGRK